MMIPYIIQQAHPTNDCRYKNIFTNFMNCEKDNLDNNVITYIIEFMFEFCSKDYGHGIQISSYDDFCEQYWRLSDVEISGWFEVFKISYYKNNKWSTWNIDEHKEEIYNQYVNKYINKLVN